MRELVMDRAVEEHLEHIIDDPAVDLSRLVGRMPWNEIDTHENKYKSLMHLP